MPLDQTSVEVEHQYHDYSGRAIPWYVRAIWVGFWCFAIYYTIRYLFPDLQLQFPQR